MAFNCTLMAPHGGIFVFPVVGNPIMYVVALVAGTIVGAILLGILKKTVENEQNRKNVQSFRKNKHNIRKNE